MEGVDHYEESLQSLKKTSKQKDRISGKFKHTDKTENPWKKNKGIKKKYIYTHWLRYANILDIPEEINVIVLRYFYVLF